MPFPYFLKPTGTRDLTREWPESPWLFSTIEALDSTSIPDNRDIIPHFE